MKFSSSAKFILAISITILLVGSLGFVAYKQNQYKADNNGSIKSPGAVTPPKASPLPEDRKPETANWKTYKNEDYIFSFSYPPEWQTKSTDNLIVLTDVRNSYEVTVLLAEVYEGGYCYKWDTEKTLEVGGKEGRIRDGIYSGQPVEICDTTVAPSKQGSTEVFIPLKDTLEVMFVYTYPPGSKDEALKYLSQILSTFKFRVTSEGKSCNHKGITYKSGEGFKDKCNSCSCLDGQVACTLIACGEE